MAVAAGISALAGLASSFLASHSAKQSKAESLAMSKEMMDYQHNINADMLNRQFYYNRYFTENAHQAEVNDLRNAGLNPILSANNGASSSVGLPASGLLDAASSAASLENSKTQRAQQALQAADVASNIELNSSSSALNREKANTERVNQAFTRAQESGQLLDNLMKSEQWKYFPEKVKLEIEQMRTNIALGVADISYKSAMSKAGLISAGAQQLGAKASYIDATSGNPYKMLNDLIRGLGDGKGVGDLAKMFRNLSKGKGNDNSSW